MELFNQKGAVFSECGKYRYALWRIWDAEKPMVGFIGLNPSTANENTDDPTIRRVVKFASTWGFGGVYMLNLFAIVTPYPEDLVKSSDPVGDNDKQLIGFASACDEIVFAWGSFKEARERAEQVKVMFPGAKCLTINANGSPRHPLYVKGDTVPIYYCK